MTQTQALARARIELGKHAHVRVRQSPDAPPKYLIGKLISVGGVPFFSIECDGASWEEAFAALELRQYGIDIKLLDSELEELIPHTTGALRVRLEKSLAAIQRRRTA
jgi:hypothetical protein